MDSSRAATSWVSLGTSKKPPELGQTLPQSVGIQSREVGSRGFRHKVAAAKSRMRRVAREKCESSERGADGKMPGAFGFSSVLGEVVTVFESDLTNWRVDSQAESCG